MQEDEEMDPIQTRWQVTTAHDHDDGVTDTLTFHLDEPIEGGRLDLVRVELTSMERGSVPGEGEGDQKAYAYLHPVSLRDCLLRTLLQIGPADTGADTQVAKVAIELSLHQGRSREHAEARCKDALHQLAEVSLRLGRLQGENAELKKALGRDA
jgi:hypothetical protein